MNRFRMTMALAVVGYTLTGEMVFRSWMAGVTGPDSRLGLWALAAVLTALTVYVLSTGISARRTARRWMRPTMLSAATMAGLGTLGALSLFGVRERAAPLYCLYCNQPAAAAIVGHMLLAALSGAAVAGMLAPFVGAAARRLFTHSLARFDVNAREQG